MDVEHLEPQHVPYVAMADVLAIKKKIQKYKNTKIQKYKNTKIQNIVKRTLVVRYI
jgi:hypothetical protein